MADVSEKQMIIGCPKGLDETMNGEVTCWLPILKGHEGFIEAMGIEEWGVRDHWFFCIGFFGLGILHWGVRNGEWGVRECKCGGSCLLQPYRVACPSSVYKPLPSPQVSLTCIFFLTSITSFLFYFQSQLEPLSDNTDCSTIIQASMSSILCIPSALYNISRVRHDLVLAMSFVRQWCLLLLNISYFIPCIPELLIYPANLPSEYVPTELVSRILFSALILCQYSDFFGMFTSSVSWPLDILISSAC